MPIKKLNGNEVAQGLKTLAGWQLDAQGTGIFKEWEFDSFRTAMDFFAQVGAMAERHNHHPEFLSRFTKMRIDLSTHDAGGLTDKDFALALDIDGLVTKVAKANDANP